MPATLLDIEQIRTAMGRSRRSTACARICGVGCQLTYHIKDDKILHVDAASDGPANHSRLCVKGRFGFDYVNHPRSPDRAADPQGRRAQVRRRRQSIRPIPGRISARPPGKRRWIAPPPACSKIRERKGGAGAGRLRLGQGLERGGLSVPEAGAHRLRHQQRRSLHAALPRLVGGGAVRGHRLGRGDGAVLGARSMPRRSSSSAPTRPATIRSPPPSSRTPSSAAPS